MAVTRRDRHLRYKYGITQAQYLTLFRKQGGKCWICKRREEARLEQGEIHSLVVDHDHVTGKVRGLLCQRCNLALGHFEDDVKRLKTAIRYLARAR